MNRRCIDTWFFNPVAAKPLAFFRILFGALMLWQVVLDFPLVTQQYNPDTFHFSYPFFSFLKPWPGQGMTLHYWVMGIAAAGLMVGAWYRLCAFVFLVTSLYVFLLDPAYYQNHYYLYCLLAFLFLVINADRVFSIDCWRKKYNNQAVPSWQILLLRAQIIIVYTFAGIAKLNPDWLHGEPMRMELAMRSYIPYGEGAFRAWAAQWMTPFFTQEWFVYMISYSGMVYDLSIGFLLLHPKTRVLAFILTIFFHSLTKFLFGLDTFPLTMIASLVLFMDFKLPRRAQLPKWTESKKQWIALFVFCYLLIQIIVPLRHFLIPGNCLWTEEGRTFSWQMKISQRGIKRCDFWLKESENELPIKVDLRKDLNPRQAGVMALQPKLILQYAHYLRDKFKAQGVKDPVITTEVILTMNGRPLQYLIDPQVDLAKVQYPWFGHATWVVQLQ